MRKMSKNELLDVKKMLLVKQNGLCPICGKDLSRTAPANQVLDHDHTTGVVRAVLHRGCNRVEGSVWNTIQRWGKAKGFIEVLGTMQRLIDFWKLHSTPQTDIIYYNHKTAKRRRDASGGRNLSRNGKHTERG